MTLESVLGCQVCSALEKQNVPKDKVFFGAKCASAILLKHYENGNNFFFSYHDPRSAKSRIYAGKSTKRGFSKKALTEIEIFFLF